MKLKQTDYSLFLMGALEIQKGIVIANSRIFFYLFHINSETHDLPKPNQRAYLDLEHRQLVELL